MNHEAIYKLNPSVVTIRGDVAYDANSNEVTYDKSAVAAYVSANAYKAQRAAEYPNIVDQLDTLFHEGIDGWKETIQAVKTKYPKP
jgi:hypothetical protein